MKSTNICSDLIFTKSTTWFHGVAARLVSPRPTVSCLSGAGYETKLQPCVRKWREPEGKTQGGSGTKSEEQGELGRQCQAGSRSEWVNGFRWEEEDDGESREPRAEVT